LPPDISFAVPGDIETRTGGYIYDRRLMLELRRAGWSVEHLRWAASFPFPTPADVAAAERSLAAHADDSLILIDGLAFGALPELAEAEGQRLQLVALVHHPLALETGLTAALQNQLAQSERRALRMTRAVIVTSKTTAQTLIRDYGVEPERLTVAEPGTDPAQILRPARSTPRFAPQLLSIGTVTPRKGHDLLVEALAAVVDLPWTCIIAGSLDRSPGTATDLRARIARHGLAARIAMIGEVDDVAALYEKADLFVLPSRHEGYGMAFAEALRHGLPVIGTTAGAIPDVVPHSAGILVPPDDIAALATALRGVIGDPDMLSKLAAGARAAGAALPAWADTAARVATALDKACD
jgi:glycosyltransferase involved in cell wall biosynthesis